MLFEKHPAKDCLGFQDFKNPVRSALAKPASVFCRVPPMGEITICVVLQLSCTSKAAKRKIGRRHLERAEEYEGGSKRDGEVRFFISVSNIPEYTKMA